MLELTHSCNFRPCITTLLFLYHLPRHKTAFQFHHKHIFNLLVVFIPLKESRMAGNVGSWNDHFPERLSLPQRASRHKQKNCSERKKWRRWCYHVHRQFHSIHWIWMALLVFCMVLAFLQTSILTFPEYKHYLFIFVECQVKYGSFLRDNRLCWKWLSYGCYFIWKTRWKSITLPT